MEDFLKKLAEYLGYTTPLVYAAMTYKFFDWLDKELSDHAKAALAGAMRLQELTKLASLRNEEVASALVEVFDRIYAFPLKSKRAFFRSALVTVVVTAFLLFELWGNLAHALKTWGSSDRAFVLFAIPFSTVANIVADYLALFIIRPWLIRAGSRPAVALLTGTLIGAAFVTGVTVVRVYLTFVFGLGVVKAQAPGMAGSGLDSLVFFILLPFLFSLPGMAVFAWLPLFGIGMLLVRAIGPLSLAVGRLQWVIKDGEKHPLKAVGIAASMFVLLLSAVWQTISRT